MSTQTRTVHVNANVSRLKSWLLPRSVSLSAMPSALQETTEREPISEQINT